MKLLLILLININILAATRVSTFNLKWFGIGGELSGRYSDEYRGPWLKEFLTTYLDKTDIFVFQEVVDKALLSSTLSELSFNCMSYSSSGSKHQYVVVCLKNHLSILPEESDSNIVFEDIANVDNTKLRPAISGIIINSKTRAPLFHLLGIHLKAGKLESELRAKQVGLLAQRINSYNDKIPTILLGDFNSYQMSEDSLVLNDLETFDTILEQANLFRVKHKYNYTFKSFNYGYLFDHVYLSNKTSYSNVEVFSACNQSFSNSTRFNNISFYNRFISDHCPLSIDIQ